MHIEIATNMVGLVSFFLLKGFRLVRVHCILVDSLCLLVNWLF